MVIIDYHKTHNKPTVVGSVALVAPPSTTQLSMNGTPIGINGQNQPIIQKNYGATERRGRRSLQGFAFFRGSGGNLRTTTGRPYGFCGLLMVRWLSANDRKGRPYEI